MLAFYSSAFIFSECFFFAFTYIRACKDATANKKVVLPKPPNAFAHFHDWCSDRVPAYRCTVFFRFVLIPFYFLYLRLDD
jgi:hypothetical protein